MDSTTTVRWNPGDVSEDHNQREESLCQNESHIDLYNEHGDSFHEAIVEKKLRDAYEEFFAEPIEFYNEHQKKKSRRLTVDSYMQSIEDDTRGKRQTKLVNGKRVVKENARQGKQLSYEITACVGNTFRQKDDDGHVIYDDTNHHVRPEEFPRELQLEILREYAYGFADRNDRFKVVNMHIHGDEGFYNKRGEWEYANIGIHIEIIPIASGFKQGLPYQNSMNKALLQMGFNTPDCYSLWAKKEQAVLEEITYKHYKEYCQTHPDFYESHGDLTLYHPVADKSRAGGLTKEQLAHEMEFDELISEVKSIKQECQTELDSVHKQSEELTQREAGISEREAEAAELARKASANFEKVLISYQLYDQEYMKVAEFEQAMAELKKRATSQVSRIEKLDLESEFYKYLQEKHPDEYETLRIIHKEFKEDLKAAVAPPDVVVPKKVEDDLTRKVQATAEYLKDVNKDYEEMQEEEALLKKGKVIPAKIKSPANLPREMPEVVKTDTTSEPESDDFEAT